MQEQLEFPLPPNDKPKKPMTRPKLRLTGIGVIRSNMDTGHLMRAVDRIGRKHHDSIPEIDNLMRELDGDFDEFDDYGY